MKRYSGFSACVSSASKPPRAQYLPLACWFAAAGSVSAVTPVLAADNPSSPPATAAAPLPVARPELAGYNILILSFDPSALGSPIPGSAVPPPAGNLPAGAAAITPASGLASRVQWIASADKKDKEKEKKEKEDAKYRLEPEFGNRPSPQSFPSTLRPPAAAQTPAAPLNTGPAQPRTLEMAGSAQLAALPLRRSLLNLGFGDVMPTSPDGNALARVLGDKRLTPRVLENLRQPLSRMVASPGKPDAGDVKQATSAAARVGQSVGYRVVLVLAVKPTTEGAAYTMLLVDSMREAGEPILFDEKGTSDQDLRESAGAAGAALVEKAVRLWQPFTLGQRVTLAGTHLDAARAAFDRGDTATAQDELNQSISLDPTRGDNYVLQGDLLKNSDPAAAAVSYRRAVDLNARDGQTWAKIAQSFATAKPADWTRSLDAGKRALDLGADSAGLRIAMATAQFGRAELLRKADRPDRAEDATFQAKQHLDRALQMAPDDPAAVRLLAKQLITDTRYEEAVQTLDRVAPMYPKDIEIQTQYANALSRLEGREEEAFVASARVWKISGLRVVDVDAPTYRRLAEGFDARLYTIGKSTIQLTTSVANAAMPRETALLQLVKLKEDMEGAEAAINQMRPPITIANDVRDARIFAADLMTQSIENHQMFLETTQDINRVRGLELFRQSIAQLNLARAK